MKRLPDNPAGTKIAKRVAKVRGVDPAGLYFHGGELTRAARHRQHRRVAFASAMAERDHLNRLIDNAVLTSRGGFMIDAFERAVAAASLGPMRGWKDWIVCVLIGAALVVGVIIGGTAYAAEGDLWLGSPLISRHQDCSKDYNKHNYGVTVDYALDADTRIGGGFYRNSLYRETYYLGAMYTPLHYGRFSAGSFLAFGTGYEPRPQLSLLGSLVLSWEAQHVGVDLLYIPRVTALRLRYAF